MATYVDAAQKEAQVDASLAQEDEVLAVMEADLQAAEARVEVAEQRYQRARRAIDRELAADAGGEASAPAAGGDRGGRVEDVPDDLQPDREPTHLGSHTAKNAGARTDKEVSRDRWLAARASEGRVRDRATKARERLRRNARDRKFQYAEAPGGDSPEAAPKAPAPEETSAPAASPVPKPTLHADTPSVKAGGQGLVERLKSLVERPSAAEKRAALIRVAAGGKEGYYTFEAGDVLEDLRQRGLLDAALAEELLALLKDAPSGKPSEVPAEGWAAGAQKASGIERLDDKPFTSEESDYLRCLEEKSWRAAEAELQAAEAQLSQLVRQAETRFPDLGADDGAGAGRAAPTGEVQVDEEYADQLEARYDPDGHRESHGTKNHSAMTSKEVSREKWEKAHDKEGRDREHAAKARDARRAEARDIKQGSADVGE